MAEVYNGCKMVVAVAVVPSNVRIYYSNTRLTISSILHNSSISFLLHNH